MRSMLSSAFALSALLALATVGCTAATADDTGAAEGAASSDSAVTVQASSAQGLAMLKNVERIFRTELSGSDAFVYEIAKGDASTLYLGVASEFGDTTLYKVVADVDELVLTGVEKTATGIKIVGSQANLARFEATIVPSGNGWSVKVDDAAPRTVTAPVAGPDFELLSGLTAMKSDVVDGAGITADIFEERVGDPALNGAQLYLDIMVRKYGAEDKHAVFDLGLDVLEVSSVAMTSSEIRVKGTEQRLGSAGTETLPFTRTIKYSVAEGAPSRSITITTTR